MANGKISKKQQEILDFIKQEIHDKGYPPAVREICKAVNLKSTSSVHAHLSTLEKNGYIKRDSSKNRAIEVTDGDASMIQMSTVSVPVIGKVAAGIPITAVENIDSYFPIPADQIARGKSFILKVQGDSMINIGIMDGDYILVNQTNTAENGELVVALVDDSATVKTFYKEKDHIRLQPENDDMDPILVPDCSILGKVYGVFRFY